MHELEHLNQIENGELSFDKNGNFSDYDVMEEVNAYQFQEYIEKGMDYKNNYTKSCFRFKRWKRKLYTNILDL